MRIGLTFEADPYADQAKSKTRPDMAWGRRHTWQSWRNRYYKNRDRFDRRIAELVKKYPPSEDNNARYNRGNPRCKKHSAQVHLDEDEGTSEGESSEDLDEDVELVDDGIGARLHSPSGRQQVPSDGGTSPSVPQKRRRVHTDRNEVIYPNVEPATGRPAKRSARLGNGSVQHHIAQGSSSLDRGKRRTIARKSSAFTRPMQSPTMSSDRTE